MFVIILLTLSIAMVKASSVAAQPFKFSANASIAYPYSPVYKIDYVLKSTNLNSFPAFIFYPYTVADVKAAVAYAIKANLKARDVERDMLRTFHCGIIVLACTVYRKSRNNPTRFTHLPVCTNK